MTTSIPTKKSDLLTAGNTALAGAVALENIIGLQHNRSADIRVNVNGFTSAETDAETAEAELTRRKTSQEKLRLARDNFRTALGQTYNQAWDALGLVGSLAIPRKYSRLPAVLLKFDNYLTANPNQEVEIKDITAARFESLYNDLNTAFTAVKTQETTLRDARILFKTNTAALRTRLRDLKKELALKLDVMDSRWLQFGFPVPGMKRRPAAPKGVKVTLSNATTVAIKWDRSARAQHYRVWKKVAGVDTDFVAIGTAVDLDFTLEDLPANATVEIAVSAVNDRGESKRSRVVSVLMK